MFELEAVRPQHVALLRSRGTRGGQEFDHGKNSRCECHVHASLRKANRLDRPKAS